MSEKKHGTPEEIESSRLHTIERNAKLRASRTDEWRKEKNSSERERVKNLSPEKKKHFKDYAHQYQLNLTPEQKAKKSLHESKKYWSLSPEDRKFLIERRCEEYRNWTQEQKDHRNAVLMARYRKDSSKFLAWGHKHRAALRDAPGSFTDSEWRNLLERFDYKCAECGRKEPEIKLTVDHFLPLSKGGSNYISNIQPLCKSCNSRKGNRLEKYSVWPEGDPDPVMLEKENRWLSQFVGLPMPWMTPSQERKETHAS